VETWFQSLLLLKCNLYRYTMVVEEEQRPPLDDTPTPNFSNLHVYDDLIRDGGVVTHSRVSPYWIHGPAVINRTVF
jgi:hypothetical protein